MSDASQSTTSRLNPLGRIPFMSRPTFRWELISSLFTGLGTGAMLPQFTQLFARKGLAAPHWIVAMLLAEVTLGNLFGALWAKLLQGRRRVVFVVASRAGIAVFLLAVAFLPARPGMALPYAALLVVPALLAAVVLSISPTVWHTNYPDGMRGRIVSWLMIVRLIGAAASAQLAGWALDAWPTWAHRLIYPAAAAAMLLGAWAYGRIRIRGEKKLLASEAGRPMHPLAGVRLFREDPAYGRFLLWQMLSGSMVLMSIPAIVMYLSDVWRVTYGEGTTALALVPLAVTALTLPLAGRVFDRIRVTRFRAAGAGLWSLGRVVILAGLVMRSWPVLLAGAAVEGLARSTGVLAFNIGHTRFTGPSDNHLYMGTHMTLQGIRGLTMPFLGAWLYGVAGIHFLWVCALLQGAAAVGFASLKRTGGPGRGDDGLAENTPT